MTILHSLAPGVNTPARLRRLQHRAIDRIEHLLNLPVPRTEIAFWRRWRSIEKALATLFGAGEQRPRQGTDHDAELSSLRDVLDDMRDEQSRAESEARVCCESAEDPRSEYLEQRRRAVRAKFGGAA